MQNTKIVFEAERLSQDFKIATNDRTLAHFNLKTIDMLLDGAKPRFHIIAGEPAAGKSTLLLQMADDLASQGQLVLFFALEMHPSRLLKKSLSRISAERAHDAATARPLDLASIRNIGNRALLAVCLGNFGRCAINHARDLFASIYFRRMLRYRFN